MRFDKMTVELAHCAGVAIGVVLTGGYDPEEAREVVKENFCEEHADIIFAGAGTVREAIRERS